MLHKRKRKLVCFVGVLLQFFFLSPWVEAFHERDSFAFAPGLPGLAGGKLEFSRFQYALAGLHATFSDFSLIPGVKVQLKRAPSGFRPGSNSRDWLACNCAFCSRSLFPLAQIAFAWSLQSKFEAAVTNTNRQVERKLAPTPHQSLPVNPWTSADENDVADDLL
jgi:hypothetical protein